MRKWDEKSADSARDLSAAKLRAEYLERAAWVRNIPEQKAYLDEIAGPHRTISHRVASQEHKRPTATTPDRVMRSTPSTGSDHRSDGANHGSR